MGFLGKLRGKFRENWCEECGVEMEAIHRQLYALPTMSVGHYVLHSEAEYYKKHLVPVKKKAEIPTGMYAGGMTAYRCPQCGRRVVKLSVFLPVREAEKEEQVLLFTQGEMDDFLWSVDRPGREFESRPPREMDSKSVIQSPRY